jgi:ATP-dependent Clp protease ATP-binding subunit ClpB
MLARGELRTIGATTLAEYRQHIEKDAAFERRFQMVTVGEPSVVDTVQILRGLKQKYEDHHGVHITDRALVVAAELSDRWAGGGRGGGHAWLRGPRGGKRLLRQLIT